MTNFTETQTPAMATSSELKYYARKAAKAPISPNSDVNSRALWDLDELSQPVFIGWVHPTDDFEIYLDPILPYKVMYPVFNFSDSIPPASYLWEAADTSHD